MNLYRQSMFHNRLSVND